MDPSTTPDQNTRPKPSKPIIPIMVPVDHYYLFLAEQLRDPCLVHLCNEAQAANRATAIFTRSITETRRISRLLDATNIGAIPIHCDLSPSERAASLDKLYRKECHVIVMTDVAAGFGPGPFPEVQVDRVINYSLTWKMNPQVYGQRTRNVGHAGTGHSGQVITLVTPYELELYLRLNKDVTLKKYTVNMDMAMACKGQVEEAVLEDPSLIESPYVGNSGGRGLS